MPSNPSGCIQQDPTLGRKPVGLLRVGRTTTRRISDLTRYPCSDRPAATASTQAERGPWPEGCMQARISACGRVAVEERYRQVDFEHNEVGSTMGKAKQNRAKRTLGR